MDSLYNICVETIINYNIHYKEGDIDIDCDKSIQIYKKSLLDLTLSEFNKFKKEFNNDVKIGFANSLIPITRLNLNRHIELISLIKNYVEKYDYIADIYIINVNKPYTYIDYDDIKLNQLNDYEDWVFHHIYVYQSFQRP